MEEKSAAFTSESSNVRFGASRRRIYTFSEQEIEVTLDIAKRISPVTKKAKIGNFGFFLAQEHRL